MAESRPLIAIIGRKNVGKSTLLNRLAGKQVSIVADLPGTTRDRIFAPATWEGKEFSLVDTGGIETAPDTTIDQRVKEQAQEAIAGADVIIFLVDARDGMLPGDKDIANMLRRSGKPVILAANKADNPALEASASEFYQLGLGKPLPLSAMHGRSTEDLLDRILELLPAAPPPTEAEIGAVKVAIVGRPGVGKSMLLNALLGENRAIVGDVPGTTRDATDSLLKFQDKNILLIDTAGIRRRGQVVAGVEQWSVLRSLRAIERSDVSLLVLDATEPGIAQDLHVAGYIQQAEKGVIIIANKTDILAESQELEYNYIRTRFKSIDYAPVLFVSAKMGWGVEKIMPEVLEIYQERLKKVTNAQVKSIVQDAMAAHMLPRKGARQLKIYSMVQSAISPPTFTFSVNDVKLVHFSYRRYLENKLREAFGFAGTPLRLVFKAGS